MKAPPTSLLPLLAGGVLLTGIDFTAVNLALPSIGSDLHAGLDELQWVLNAFALASAGSLVTAGITADRLGRRRTYLAGLLLFGLTSTLCGLASGPIMLIAARGLQGAAIALAYASGLALLVANFSGPARARALGLYSAIGGLSWVIGPPLGGAIVDAVGWRWIFAINLPLALALAVAVAAVVPHDQPAQRRALDLPGAALLTGASALLIFALLQASHHDLGDAVLVLPAAAGVLGLVGFALHERRAAAPIIAPDLWRHRGFVAGLAGLGLGIAAFFGILLLASVYAQGVLGLDALQTSIVFLATIVPYSVTAPLGGILQSRVQPQLLGAAGLLLAAAGLLALSRLDPGAGAAGLVPGLLLAGLGGGLMQSPLMSCILDAVPAEIAGSVSGTVQTVRYTAQAAGTAVLVVVLQSGLAGRLHARTGMVDRIAAGDLGGIDPARRAAVTDAYVAAFSHSALVAAAVAIAGAAICALLVQRRGPQVGIASTMAET